MAGAVLPMARGSIPALNQRYQKIRIVEIWENTRLGIRHAGQARTRSALSMSRAYCVQMRLDDR
jgi:hypothetical protein